MPAAAERAARYAQVGKLLAERNSQRSIVRVTAVSRMTVTKLAKKRSWRAHPFRAYQDGQNDKDKMPGVHAIVERMSTRFAQPSVPAPPAPTHEKQRLPPRHQPVFQIRLSLPFSSGF